MLPYGNMLPKAAHHQKVLSFSLKQNSAPGTNNTNGLNCYAAISCLFEQLSSFLRVIFKELVCECKNCLLSMTGRMRFSVCDTDSLSKFTFKFIISFCIKLLLSGYPRPAVMLRPPPAGEASGTQRFTNRRFFIQTAR